MFFVGVAGTSGTKRGDGRIWGNALTRGRPILHSDSDRAVEVTPYGYHLWVDSPTLLLQRELTAFLRQAGLAKDVVTSDANSPADWVVTGFIERLDHTTGGGAPRVLVSLWNVDDAATEVFMKEFYGLWKDAGWSAARAWRAKA